MYTYITFMYMCIHMCICHQHIGRTKDRGTETQMFAYMSTFIHMYMYMYTFVYIGF